MAEPETQQPLKPFESHRSKWILQAESDADGGPYRFRVTPGRARTLGRSTSADFVLNAVLVSRFHCSLSVADGELTVENMSHSNGTFVNDRRVERAVLQAGDRLRAGRIEFLVSPDSSEGDSPPAE
jgi:pSer/pThr/pTyr-binding forkhead associated (FHA) protein